MADIKSINGNPIVVGTSGIEDGSITDAKLASNGFLLNFDTKYHRLAENFEEFPSEFVNGATSSSDGSIITSGYGHRIVSSDIMHCDSDTRVVASEGFRFYIHTYDADGTSKQAWYWATEETIPSETYYRITIARVESEEVPVYADISLFKTKVMRQTAWTYGANDILVRFKPDALNDYMMTKFHLSNYNWTQHEFVFGGYLSVFHPVKFPYDVTVTNIGGENYYFNVKTWSSETVSESTYVNTFNWKDGSVTVPANTWFTVEYTRRSNSVSNPEVNEMRDYVSFAAVTDVVDFDASAASYAEYVKNYLARDMQPKYWSGGQVISAPNYFCHVANHVIPIGVTVDFGGKSFKVEYYNKDGDTKSRGFLSWDANPKYIEPNTYFMISAQNDTALSTKEWYDLMTVTADDAITAFNDFTLPRLDYAESWTGKKRFQLLWFSDIHAQQYNLKTIVDYYNAHQDSLNDAICTGDLVSNKFTDDYTFWDTAGAGGILTTIGNHDGFKGSDGWATNAEMFPKFFAPYIDDWGVVYTSGMCNWYKVYDSSIMLIGLTAVAPGTDMDATYSFLTTALDLAKTEGYAVIVAHHYPVDPDYTDGMKTAFETPFAHPEDLYIPESFVSAVQSFRDDGGEFVCYITGHTHYDMTRKRRDNGQIILTVGTAHVDAGIQSNSAYRGLGTKYYDLFNILSVDRTNKVVSIKRIGSDRDVWFRRMDSLAINYQTGEII